MKTIKRARFDGSVLIPEEPLDLPVDTVVEFEVPVPPQNGQPEKTVLQLLAEDFAGFPEDPDWPTDMSAEHDHYLYGTPKKS